MHGLTLQPCNELLSCHSASCLSLSTGMHSSTLWKGQGRVITEKPTTVTQIKHIHPLKTCNSIEGIPPMWPWAKSIMRKIKSTTGYGQRRAAEIKYEIAPTLSADAWAGLKQQPLWQRRKRSKQMMPEPKSEVPKILFWPRWKKVHFFQISAWGTIK